MRSAIHGDAIQFVVERYKLTESEEALLASVPIRWRRGRGASAFYQRRAHGFSGPHILLRLPPGDLLRWHTYRRARAKFTTPATGVEIDSQTLATAVMVHELTHAVQFGVCGHAKRAFSEVETTENEIEFVRRRAPQSFRQLLPVVRRTKSRARAKAAPPSGLAVLRAIVLRAAGSLAGLIRPKPVATPQPRSRQPHGRLPKPTES